MLTSCDYRDNFPPRLFRYFKFLAVLSPLVPLLFAPVRLRAGRRLPFTFGWLTHRPMERRAEDSYLLPVLGDRRVRADLNKAIRGVDRRLTNEAAVRLGEFERPALIAWSRDDRVFPLEHAERLAADLPHARLAWIEGARSFSPEDQPERLATLIAGFVREPAGDVQVAPTTDLHGHLKEIVGHVGGQHTADLAQPCELVGCGRFRA